MLSKPMLCHDAKMLAGAGSVGLRGWRTKYYKGLGTSQDSEAVEYFSNLPRHVVEFKWEGEPLVAATMVSAGANSEPTPKKSKSARKVNATVTVESANAGLTREDDLIEMAFKKGAHGRPQVVAFELCPAVRYAVGGNNSTHS